MEKSRFHKSCCETGVGKIKSKAGSGNNLYMDSTLNL
jgi:hypothetical protein